MQAWWSPSEIAEAGLPDLPGTVQGMFRLVIREGWRTQRDHARRRPGKGGGWEYHYTLFPARAQARLLRTTPTGPADGAETGTDRNALWAAYDALPEQAKVKARRALRAVEAVALLTAGGMTQTLAVSTVATQSECSARTVMHWLAAVKGVRSEDRLAHLAPKHRAVKRKSCRAGIDPAAWAFFKDDYLRPGEVTFTSCYARLREQAQLHDWTVPSEASLRRRIKAEIPAELKVLARTGEKALKALYPAQVRDRTAMRAMEGVNADYHKWDVFVQWPDGSVGRPQMVVFEDLYSGLPLSWRYAKTANSSTVRLAFGDMLEKYGIPERCLLDNGMEFASKQVTGGAKSRFRNKIKDDEIEGFMPALGVQVHWATPESGQSKPVERTFRDFCNDIAKDPRFAGAYCGNSPVNKPENFDGTPVKFEYFRSVVEEGIRRHNARPGRKSQTAEGRSLDETFAESFAKAEVRKVTEAQRRFFLLGADRARTNSRNGELKLMGNKYRSPWILAHAGKPVTIRFDPDDLHAGVHVYGLDGAWLGMAECHEKAGFFDADAAREHGRARRQFMKSAKEQKKAEGILGGKVAAEMMDRMAEERAGEVAPDPQAKVIRPRFDLRDMKRPEAVELTEAEAAAQEAIIHAFASPARTDEDENPELERFRLARDLEARIATGGDVSADDRAWLHGYQQTADYRGYAKIVEDFGEGALKA